ncbi:MFS transporter [Actinoplanes sp. NPDC048791]|uniref:MFS transporter n=1 Tax=Actinoplanes sp. NPDC048791 TaxID=3154623 RepID=UPI0033DBF25D
MKPVTEEMTDDHERPVPAWSSRNFRRLWRGSAASTLGSEVAEIALPLFALVTLSASAAQASTLRVAQFLPFLLATVPAGLLVDRFRHSRLRLMIGADLGRALLVALLPVAAWTGTAGMPTLYVVVFAAAVLTVIYQIADFAVLPTIVSEGQIVDANGKLAATQSAAEIGGRGIGALLVQALSAPVALLLNAGGYLLSAISLSRIRLNAPTAQPADDEPAVDVSPRRELLRGIRFTVRQRFVRPLLGEAATFNLFNEILLLGLMLYAVREAHLSPVAIGAVFTAGGIGSFAGAWSGARFTARFGYGRVLLVTLALGNGAPLGVLLANQTGSEFGLLALLCSIFVVMGIGIGIANVHAVSLRQAATPEALRGQVNAAYRLVSWGAIPVGAAVGGVIATQTDPFTAMVTGAIGVSVSTLWVALSAVPALRSIHDAARS